MLVTRGPGGRIHKSVLPYSVLEHEALAGIKKSCDDAAALHEARKKGAVVGLPSPGQSEDIESLRAELARLHERLDAQPAGGDADAGNGGETIQQIKDAIEAAAEGEEREAVKAKYREAELARDEQQQRKGVLDATLPAGD